MTSNDRMEEIEKEVLKPAGIINLLLFPVVLIDGWMNRKTPSKSIGVKVALSCLEVWNDKQDKSYREFNETMQEVRDTLDKRQSKFDKEMEEVEKQVKDLNKGKGV